MRSLLISILIVVAAAGFGVLIGAAESRGRTGQRVLVSRQQTFEASRVLEGRRPFVTLEREQITSHGGTLHVQWYSGSWQPLRPRSGSYVSLLLDGRRVASAILETAQGRRETEAGLIGWAGAPPSGAHSVEIRLEAIDGSAALPYVPGTRPVPQSLSIVEYGGS